MMALTVVLVGVMAALWLNRPNDAHLIRREWQQVLQLCRKDDAGSVLSAVTRPLELQMHFTTNALVETGAPYPLSIRRAELPSVFGRLWQMAGRIQVQSRGEDIVIAKSRRTAEMEVTVEVRAEVQGEIADGVDAYRLKWSREEGPWRIQRVQRMDTIKNPAIGTY